MKPERRPYFTPEAAEKLAVDGLSFLAANPDALGRFLALTGIGPGQLRRAAEDPGFLAGVLDYYLSDEPLLVAFANHAGLSGTAVAAARHALDTTEPS